MASRSPTLQRDARVAVLAGAAGRAGSPAPLLSGLALLLWLWAQQL